MYILQYFKHKFEVLIITFIILTSVHYNKPRFQHINKKYV